MKQYKHYKDQINDKLYYYSQAAWLQNVTTYLGRATFCVMAERPGVLGWLTQVEYTWFKPCTDDNDKFWLATLRWPYTEDPKQGLLWMVVTIPTSHEDRALYLLVSRA
jgi:hypothetical protein